MSRRIKLSELTYDLLLSLGLPKTHMHTDASDCVRELRNSEQTEKAKRELSAKYGDVDLIITPDAVWYDRIRIDDQKWREDHEAFCEKKQAWCDKYGCD